MSDDFDGGGAASPLSMVAVGAGVGGLLLRRSIGTSMRGLGRQKYAARRTGNQVSSRRLAV